MPSTADVGLMYLEMQDTVHLMNKKTTLSSTLALFISD